MLNLLYVAAGAGIGGGLRYILSETAAKYIPGEFPYGTLLVNFLGSLSLGFLVFYFFEKSDVPLPLKLLLTTGFCGGFTTFSTFSLETFNLLRSGAYISAGLNITGNVLLTIGGIAAALLIAKQLQ